MKPITLPAGQPVSVSVQGSTLTILNDPTMAPSLLWSDPSQNPDGRPDVVAGTVLVGFGGAPGSPAGADVIVPPFSMATVPVPSGVDLVYLVYPGNPAGATSVAALTAPAQLARTRSTRNSNLSPALGVFVAWSDESSPLAIWPTGRILPLPLSQGVSQAGDARSTLLPVDNNQSMIPPSPATPVYDQDIFNTRGGPYFRPHIAPSGVSVGSVVLGALNTPVPLPTSGPYAYTAGDGKDPFNHKNSSAWLRVILRVYVSVSIAARYVIGSDILTVANPGVGELIRFRAQNAGTFAFDFGEGIAPNWFNLGGDAGTGQFQVYADQAGPAVDVMIVHG